MASLLAGPPATTRLVSNELVTSTCAFNPVAVTLSLLGDGLGSSAAVTTLGSATASTDPECAVATPTSLTLRFDVDRALMGAWLTPPTCTLASAAFDTLLCVFRPVADALPEAARLWPTELGLAPGLLAETLPEPALARLPTDTAAEL